MQFSQFPAAALLRELALNPIDMTVELTPERIGEMTAEALGLKLFFGTERVSGHAIQDLFRLAVEADAVEKMRMMQAGETVNFIEGFDSEKRPALHTAMRDFFEHPMKAPKAQEAAKLAFAEVEKLKAFLPKMLRFTDLVQIGIGGSSLGPEAVYRGLEAFSHPGRKVHFLANVDPDDGSAIFREVDLSKTVFVVVSKSGSTLETLTNETFARDKLQKAGLNPKDHMIAVTGKGSPLDDPSKYLASFHMWDYVGGRYSATSMVGLVMLAFAAGMDNALEFLHGASAMDKVALKSSPLENLPLLSALLGIWNRNFLHLPTLAVIPYSQALSRFPAHLQQLDMESNGKRIDKQGIAASFDTGPVVWGEPGTNGQHSFYQLIHQGTSTVPLEFIGFKESQRGDDITVQGTTSQQKLLANLFAQSIALAQGQQSANPNKFFPGNRPNRILLGKRLDPFTMGAILAYYEHKVAFQGFIWNINSFDQEGVQLGKVLASKLIDQFAGRESNFPLGKALLAHM